MAASDRAAALPVSALPGREFGAIRGPGRSPPVKIYELRAEPWQERRQQVTAAAAYAEGLAHWRGREFDAAARCFERAADFDKPSALFLQRARAFGQHPPDTDWEAVTTLEAK